MLERVGPSVWLLVALAVMLAALDTIGKLVR
jgi:hypothetical protein